MIGRNHFLECRTMKSLSDPTFIMNSMPLAFAVFTSNNRTSATLLSLVTLTSLPSKDLVIA